MLVLKAIRISLNPVCSCKLSRTERLLAAAATVCSGLSAVSVGAATVTDTIMARKIVADRPRGHGVWDGIGLLAGQRRLACTTAVSFVRLLVPEQAMKWVADCAGRPGEDGELGGKLPLRSSWPDQWA